MRLIDVAGVVCGPHEVLAGARCVECLVEAEHARQTLGAVADGAHDAAPELALADRQLIGEACDFVSGVVADSLHGRAYDRIGELRVVAPVDEPREEGVHRVWVVVEDVREPRSVLAPYLIDARLEIAKLLGGDPQQRGGSARPEARSDHPAAGADIGHERGRVRADDVRLDVLAPDDVDASVGQDADGRPIAAPLPHALEPRREHDRWGVLAVAHRCAGRGWAGS
jgi:hypothetical protein